MASPHLLEDLALVCCVAALTAVLCHRLKQPVVLGYLLAGVLVGPHVPQISTADEANVRVLSELGVTLLMFSIGLGFHLRRLTRLLSTAGVMVALGVPAVFGMGFLVARLLGWSPVEAVFAGSLLVVSSSALLERALRESGVRGAARDVTFGVTIVEDLVAVLLLAVLTAVASGMAVRASELTGTFVRLAGFLAAIVVVGLFAVPPMARAVARVASTEVSTVAAVGLCFAFAWLARSAGYSVALGAFLAGMLVAESGAGRRIEGLVAPLRDVFAAVFFVSVGMLLDPKLLLEHLPAVFALLAVVIFGRATVLGLGAFLTGMGIKESVRAGLTLAQIGEFSFLIAAIGVESGAVRPFLYPVAVAVAVLAALVNPWLVRASPRLAERFEHHLPEGLSTLASLYTSWLEGWRTRNRTALPRRRLLTLALWLAVDLVLICGVVISAAIWHEDLRAMVQQRVSLGPALATWALAAAGALACLPFGFGALRLCARLGNLVAENLLPLPPAGRVDAAFTPRRALAVVVQFAIVALSGVVVQTATQAFVPPLGGLVVLALVLAVLAVSVWQRVNELEGHVQAGAQMIAAALTPAGGRAAAPSIEELERLLPGIGRLTLLGLAPQSAAIGRTLGELDLPARTGASVVAIERDGDVLVQPADDEGLRLGDVLALSGSQDAVREAALTLGRSTRA